MYNLVEEWWLKIIVLKGDTVHDFAQSLDELPPRSVLQRGHTLAHRTTYLVLARHGLSCVGTTWLTSVAPGMCADVPLG